MSTRRTRLIAALSILVAVLPAGPAAADSWTRVGSGGLGDPARGKSIDLTIHGGFVWVSSTDELPGRFRPRLFRRPLVGDEPWTDATPPWGDAVDGHARDLFSFAGDLYVATSFGQVWRHRGASWSNATPPWAGTLPVHALAAWELVPGTATLCAARGSLELHCGVETGTTTTLPRAPLRDTRPVGQASLIGFRDRLVLAVGGGSEGSRTCEAWLFGGRWTAMSLDCFGDAGRTWAGQMAILGEHVYVGTGGHRPNGVFELSHGGTYRDVTPALHAFEQIHRYKGAGVAAGRLFVSAHVAFPPPGFADVVSTPDGDAWTHSNLPGFGPGFTNSTVEAMDARGPGLYAATVNLENGFEVWRRNFLVAEMIDENSPAYRDLIVELRRQALCLRHRIRGCPSRLVIAERFALLKEGVDTARHPDDDTKLILVTRQRFAAAGKELAAALELADQADKIALFDPAKAKPIYLKAAQHLESAMKTTRAAWEAVVAALRPGKG